MGTSREKIKNIKLFHFFQEEYHVKEVLFLSFFHTEANVNSLSDISSIQQLSLGIVQFLSPEREGRQHLLRV